jgi:hypothetical protein
MQWPNQGCEPLVGPLLTKARPSSPGSCMHALAKPKALRYFMVMPGVVGRTDGSSFVERRCSPDPLERRPVMRWDGSAYLVCPQCSAWRYALYLTEDGHWLCRACGRWDYSCRHELQDPALAAAHLRRRLGGSPGLLDPLPPRPEGRAAQHEYDRLVVAIVAAEARALARSSQRGPLIEAAALEP